MLSYKIPYWSHFICSSQSVQISSFLSSWTNQHVVFLRLLGGLRHSSPLKHSWHVCLVVVSLQEEPPTLIWLHLWTLPVNLCVLQCCFSKYLPSAYSGVTALTWITPKVPLFSYFVFSFDCFATCHYPHYWVFRVAGWIPTPRSTICFSAPRARGRVISGPAGAAGRDQARLEHSFALFWRADVFMSSGAVSPRPSPCLEKLRFNLLEVRVQSSSSRQTGISTVLRFTVSFVHLAVRSSRFTAGCAHKARGCSRRRSL